MITARMVAAACALMLMAACSRGLPDVAGAKIVGYNHTTDYIHQFYVNGAYGGNIHPYGGGGSFVCCITYPRQWTPELKAKVRWTTSDADPKGSPEETWHETVAPIERYQETGTRLDVHFLPDGNVRVLVTSMSAGHPDYPGPAAPEKPADYLF